MYKHIRRKRNEYFVKLYLLYLRFSSWIKYLVAYATLFDLLFSQADIDTSRFFTHSNFAWELHGGVDVMWCGGLFVLGLH
jgi:hypothetical protein